MQLLIGDINCHLIKQRKQLKSNLFNYLCLHSNLFKLTQLSFQVFLFISVKVICILSSVIILNICALQWSKKMKMLGWGGGGGGGGNVNVLLGDLFPPPTHLKLVLHL